MGLFDNVLGINLEENLDTKALAASKVDEVNKKLDISTTGVSIDDSDEPTQLEEFDNAYRKDSQVFQSINSKVQLIMGAGHELRTDNKQDPDNKVLKFFNEFLDLVGEIGEQSTWDEILGDTFFSQMKYGMNHIELMYNKKHSKVLDLLIHDSKDIDFARDSKGQILLDKYGRVVGYTRQFPLNAEVEGKGDEAPEEVHLKNKMIFLLPKRIAYSWLYGTKRDPLGLVEPSYKSVVYKQNIQEAQANSIYQRGMFPIIDYVGSAERFPTPKMIKNATDKLKMMQHNRYFAFPYWHKIEPLEVKQSDVVDNTVKSFKEEIAASMGMPLVLSTGSGESTNKSTLKIQTQFLGYSLKDIVKKTVSGIRRNIFKVISKLMKFEDSKGKLIIPYIVWGEIGVESKDDKADRLAKLLKQGGITPEYVIPYVIKSENLQIDKELNILVNTPSNDKKDKEEQTTPKKKEIKKQLSGPKKTKFSYSEVEAMVGELHGKK